jgi:hypothetical protein
MQMAVCVLNCGKKNYFTGASSVGPFDGMDCPLRAHTILINNFNE